MWVECQCPAEKHYIKSTTWKNNTTKKRNISDSAYSRYTTLTIFKSNLTCLICVLFKISNVYGNCIVILYNCIPCKGTDHLTFNLGWFGLVYAV
jgi:hypothetical protein